MKFHFAKMNLLKNDIYGFLKIQTRIYRFNLNYRSLFYGLKMAFTNFIFLNFGSLLLIITTLLLYIKKFIIP